MTCTECVLPLRANREQQCEPLYFFLSFRECFFFGYSRVFTFGYLMSVFVRI